MEVALRQAITIGQEMEVTKINISKIINVKLGLKFLFGGFKFEAQRALVIDETPLRVF